SGPAPSGQADVSPASDSAQIPPAGYPVMALLEPVAPAFIADRKGPGTPGAVETPAAGSFGGRVRRILDAVPTEIEAARERHLTSSDHTAREWSRATRLARGCAPFISTPWRTDPVAELRRADIQQLLLWHARR